MLIAFAARACLVRVIRAAAPSAFVVLDSPSDPIDALISTRQDDGSYQGVIAVYAAGGKNHIEGLGFFAGEPRLDVCIQILLPTQITLTGADGASVIALDSRRSGGDFALDITARAIMRALSLRGDQWSALFGSLVFKFGPVEWGSYLVETTHIKTPGREIRMACETLQEPTPGRDISGFWADFLAAMQGDDEFQTLASWVEAELTSPQGLSQTEIDRVYLGVSQTAMAAIGLGSAPDVIPAQVGTDSGAVDEEVTASADPSAPDVQVGP